MTEQELIGCRPQKYAARWAQMVLTEFFAQSDKERELELPVTPFMDRGKIIIANEQVRSDRFFRCGHKRSLHTLIESD